LQLDDWVAVAFDVAVEVVVVVVVVVVVDLQPTLAEPFVLYRIWKKKWALSEPKASLPISHFLYRINGNPRRGIG
jgi:hypothetical protein